MVNINIELPDGLHKKVRIASTLQERTLKDYVIAALRKRVAQDAPEATR